MRPDLVLVLVLVLGAPAFASNDVFNAQNFAPPTDPFGYASVEGARTLEPLRFFAGGYYDFADRPLVVNGFTVERDFQTFDVVGSIGLAKVGLVGLQAGAHVPLTIHDHDGPHGDLRTELKASFFDRDADFFALSARSWIEWPTGPKRDGFVSNSRKYAAGVEGTLEGNAGFIRGAISLGWEWLDGRFEGGGFIVDDQLRLGFAIALAPLRDLAGLESAEIAFEVTHWTLSGRPWDNEETSPVEFMTVARYHKGFFAEIGAGAGLNDGFGAPELRFVAALGHSF